MEGERNAMTFRLGEPVLMMISLPGMGNGMRKAWRVQVRLCAFSLVRPGCQTIYEGSGEHDSGLQLRNMAER